MASDYPLGWLVAFALAILLAVLGFLGTLLEGGTMVIAYAVGVVIGALAVWTGYELQIASSEDRQASGQPSDSPTPGESSNFEFPEDDQPDTEDEQAELETKSRITAAVETALPAAVGVLPVLYLAYQDFAFPALAIGVGAIVTALILLLVSGRTYYAGGGALFCLLTAGVIDAGLFPPEYEQSPFGVLLSLGIVSGLIVTTHLSIGVVLQRKLAGVTGEGTALKIYDAVAAIIGLIGIVWTVLTIHEKAVRYGGVTVGGTTGFVLNLLGVELPIPWFISGGVDASLILFVGGVLIGFHTLESLHTTWRATKATAKAGVGAGKKAGQKASSAASTVRERRETEP